MSFSARFARFAGPFYLTCCFVVAGLLLLSVSRLSLMLWQWPRVVAAGDPGWLLLQGVRADFIVLGLLVAVPVLLSPLLALHGRSWRLFCVGWYSVALFALIFIELSTPSFIAQYDIRPNRLYIEYLKYPKEVLSTLWHGFRVPFLLGISLTLVLVAFAGRWLRRQSRQQRCFGKVRLWLVWPLVLLLVFAAIRSTTQHRPANPAMFALTSDAMVNSLVISSGYSVLYAIYSLRHEARSSDMYGVLEPQRMLALSRSWPWLAAYQFPRADLPTWHYQQATVRRTKPLNLVIVLQESMGATFVQSLGGVAVTPELEKLKTEGIWLQNLYATGTRSVRGIEAVVAGFAPTPAQSTVKLAGSQQHFSTLASILQHAGYQTQFIYGGEAHFDNMRSFFTGNGITQVVDFNQIAKPAFVGSWGASDEDLFRQADQEISRLHQSGQPFFSLIFTSSNHEPFEFPEGRIALDEEPKNTVNHAVKYADWAMGQFFAKARQSAYWQDTLFLVVADHDNRVYGSNLVPVEKFHIPGLILGADVKPRQWDTLASQIDLAPTLLSLMGVSSCHPMTGRDITQDPQAAGRALLQFDNYFALKEPDGITILKPDGSVQRAGYNEAAKELVLSPLPASTAQYERALAEVQLPAYLYREHKYQSAHDCGQAVVQNSQPAPERQQTLRQQRLHQQPAQQQPIQQQPIQQQPVRRTATASAST